jgi:hypothetical protein
VIIALTPVDTVELPRQGNLGRVDFITENEYDLFIRPDTCNPRVRFWFHFTVDNVQEDQARILLISFGRTLKQNLIEINFKMCF